VSTDGRHPRVEPAPRGAWHFDTADVDAGEREELLAEVVSRCSGRLELQSLRPAGGID
jgi:hypothetical protein